MVGTIVDSAKAVAKLAHEYDHMDLYKQAVELMAQVTEAATENFELKKRIGELEKQLELKSKLVFRDNAYWCDETKDGPFCSACFDASGKPIRLVHMPDSLLGFPGVFGRRSALIGCPICLNHKQR